MKSKNEKQAVGLQMVEIDQSRFAIEIKDGEVRANLTQMAKPYGARPADWLRTEESIRYLDALSSTHKCVLTDLVQVRNGGRNEEKGTWAYNHNVVVEFARWLNPMFAIQVNELVWQLITGKTKIATVESHEPANEYSYLLELVDKASVVLGTQTRLASRLGFSSSVFSHLRTMPWLTGDTRKKQIELACKQIISEGAAYIPKTRDNETNKNDILIDVCRIEDTEVRMSLLDKLITGGLV